MWNRSLAIILLLVAFAAAQTSAPSAAQSSATTAKAPSDPLAGHFDGNHYSNDFFRMQLTLPSEWFPSTNWMVPAGNSKKQLEEAETWRTFHRKMNLLFIAVNRSEIDTRSFWALPRTGLPEGPSEPALGGHEHEEIDVRALTVLDNNSDLVAIRRGEIEMQRGGGTLDFHIADTPSIYSGVAFTRVDYRTQTNDINNIYHTSLFAIRNGSILSFRFRVPRHQKRLQQVVDAVMGSIKFDNTPASGATATASPAKP
jgi:hypothetical protein